jgi:putative redox protein
MELNLRLIESPYVFELMNEEGNITYIDAAPKIGGKQKGLRPMQLLAGSLASCIAIDLLSILSKKRIKTEFFEIKIIGERVEKGTATPFGNIALQIGVPSGIDLEMVQKNANLVLEKYCSVASSLHPEIKIGIKVFELAYA